VDRGKCRGCQQDILWTKTIGGKTVPLNAQPEKRFVVVRNERGQDAVELVDTYLSHFASCPAADQFRRRHHDG
jgi:hypothetical protein